MLKITKSITAADLRAIERAAANRAAGRIATLVGPRTYKVPSSTGDGTAYTVRVFNPSALLASCDCPHGQSTRPGRCWHQVAAICAETRRVSSPRPAA